MIAVITAGGRVDGTFKDAIGTPIKALAPWREGRLLDPAIAVARECGAERTYLIAPPEMHHFYEGKVDGLAHAVDSGSANLETALRFAQPTESLLLLTSDMPFITAQAVKDFLGRVGVAEISMPIATGEAYEKEYPKASDHVTKLGSERIANGSVFFFSSGTVAQKCIPVAKRLFEGRKSLFEMAKLLEPMLLLRFLMKTLRIEDLEAYALRRFALNVHAVRNCSPNLCYDIDSLADYQYATKYTSTT